MEGQESMSVENEMSGSINMQDYVDEFTQVMIINIFECFAMEGWILCHYFIMLQLNWPRIV